jgi:hypothetical protein
MKIFDAFLNVTGKAGEVFGFDFEEFSLTQQIEGMGGFIVKEQNTDGQESVWTLNIHQLDEDYLSLDYVDVILRKIKKLPHKVDINLIFENKEISEKQLRFILDLIYYSDSISINKLILKNCTLGKMTTQEVWHDYADYKQRKVNVIDISNNHLSRNEMDFFDPILFTRYGDSNNKLLHLSAQKLMLGGNTPPYITQRIIEDHKDFLKKSEISLFSLQYGNLSIEKRTDFDILEKIRDKAHDEFTSYGSFILPSEEDIKQMKEAEAAPPVVEVFKREVPDYISKCLGVTGTHVGSLTDSENLEKLISYYKIKKNIDLKYCSRSEESGIVKELREKYKHEKTVREVYITGVAKGESSFTHAGAMLYIKENGKEALYFSDSLKREIFLNIGKGDENLTTPLDIFYVPDIRQTQHMPTCLSDAIKSALEIIDENLTPDILNFFYDHSEIAPKEKQNNVLYSLRQLTALPNRLLKGVHLSSYLTTYADKNDQSTVNKKGTTLPAFRLSCIVQQNNNYYRYRSLKEIQILCVVDAYQSLASDADKRGFIHYYKAHAQHRVKKTDFEINIKHIYNEAHDLCEQYKALKPQLKTAPVFNDNIPILN